MARAATARALPRRAAARAPKPKPRAKRKIEPRRRVASGVVWIGARGGPARGRRGAQRRRAAAQRPARRDAARSGTSCAPTTRSSAPRSRRRPPPDGSSALASGRLGLRPATPRVPRPEEMKLTNRRIRLRPRRLRLRVRGDVRARGLAPGSPRRQLRAAGAGQHKATIVEPGGAGDDLRPHGRPARDRPAGDDGLRRPALIRDPKSTAETVAHVAQDRPDQVLAAALRPIPRLRLHRAQGRPRRAPRSSRRRASSASASRTRSSASTRWTRSRRRSSATRGRTTTASRASSSGSRQALRKAGQRDRDPRPRGPGDRRPQLDPGSGGPERHAHDRPHDPGPGRGVLRSTIDQWHAKGASAIVLDPRTGGVLAMAVEKGYNANRFPIVPKDRQRNRTVTDTYEPGSTFKLVTVSAVLSEGLVTPSTAFTLPYSIHVADRDHPRRAPARDRAADGRPDPVAARRTSGRSRSPRSSARSGSPMDQPLRLRAPDRHRLPRRDAAGSCRRSTSGRARRSGRFRSGTGSRSRPVQMAAAYGTVANDGVWLQPHLVDRDRLAVIGATCVAARSSRRACRAQVLKMMRGRRHRGHRPGGEGSRATRWPARRGPRRSRIRAAATRRRSTWPRSSAWCPATNPRLVMLVTVDEPRGVDLGRRRGGAGLPADRRVRPAVPGDSAGRPRHAAPAVAAERRC